MIIHDFLLFGQKQELSKGVKLSKGDFKNLNKIGWDFACVFSNDHFALYKHLMLFYKIMLKA